MLLSTNAEDEGPIRLAREFIKKSQIPELTTKHGLLFEDDKLLETLDADCLAHRYGFAYAEQLVQFVELVDRLNQPGREVIPLIVHADGAAIAARWNKLVCRSDWDRVQESKQLYPIQWIGDSTPRIMEQLDKRCDYLEKQ
jgi:hypothetical protein